MDVMEDPEHRMARTVFSIGKALVQMLPHWILSCDFMVDATDGVPIDDTSRALSRYKDNLDRCYSRHRGLCEDMAILIHTIPSIYWPKSSIKRYLS